MKTLVATIISLLFVSNQVNAQKTETVNNKYVLLKEGETEASLLRKATQVVPSPRQLHWQEMELTGFIHFGINTFTNKEWGDGSESPAIFNPTALDARQWVRACKDAGIKLIILTAKHHDGFCLWPSKFTEHSVKNSPWKNGQGDVVKEAAAACKEYGLSFGIYLSPWDRNSPFFGDSAKYNDYFVNQLTELLTQYGKIDEVWFDGANGEGPGGKKQVYDFNRWYATIRKLQPGAVIAVMGPDVRWVGTESGYGRETEWSVVPGDALLQDKIAANSQQKAGFAPKDLMQDDLGSREQLRQAKSLIWYPAETDVSIRPGWFYHTSEDTLVKSPGKLMDIYYSSVGRNGVLLLNIPPDTRGLIHEADEKNLQQWKQLRDLTFKTNLLVTSKSPGVLTDGKTSTHWTTKAKDTTAILEFTLDMPSSFDVLVLQENIRKGQRVEKFMAEYYDGVSWVKFAEGTTIGYKRIIPFKTVEAQRVRLRILSSRLQPFISEIGLYKQAF